MRAGFEGVGCGKEAALLGQDWLQSLEASVWAPHTALDRGPGSGSD